jgi:hypothetical protein
MHLVAVLNMERRRQVAVASGADRRARSFAASLERIARDGVVLAAAISEHGQDLTRPSTIATRIASGWRIEGRKMFCTMAPAATDLYVAVTYADDEGTERYAYAMVPTDAPGVVVHDDWDALGMRASGSNSISLHAKGRADVLSGRTRRTGLAPRQHLGKVDVSASGWVMHFVGSESERELADDACCRVAHCVSRTPTRSTASRLAPAGPTATVASARRPRRSSLVSLRLALRVSLRRSVLRSPAETLALAGRSLNRVAVPLTFTVPLATTWHV